MAEPQLLSTLELVLGHRGEFLRAATWPQFADVVFEIFGGILTAAEREWLEFFAEVGMLSANPVMLASNVWS